MTGNVRTVMAVASFALLARGATAQVVRTDTLRLADALRIATDSNPMLRAARSSAVAAAERVGPAGALPDPQLQFGIMNRMISDLGSTADPMTMNQIQLMQMLPWPGKLGNARAAAQHTANAAHADAEEQLRMLRGQVRMTYYELAYTDRALAVSNNTRTLLQQLLSVTTTMYAVGSAVQQDVLRGQVEVARMAEEITRMGQERLAMAARLNALLGRGADQPIGLLQLPEVRGDVPSVDSLVHRALDSRPAIRASAERTLAADATLAAARRELYPDLQIGFQYQQRPLYPDMASAMIGVNLPLFAGSKQLGMRRQMAAMRDMAAAESLNVHNETVARVIETRARADQDLALMRLYRNAVLPQSRTAVQAALTSYRVGQVSFMQLLDNQMTVNRYEIELVRSQADYQEAIGDLEALVGGPVEVTP